VEVAAGVARTVGADSVYYISREGFAKAAGVPLEELCFSCVTGNYAQPVHFETAEARRGSAGQ
ncbi:MAG: amidophosphoribosyltransferase, partial [Candidatus Marsarchaeota archaeon]|nr:amidophosphoribosyltransferase [Candidatus Marsarchaeota archaeon]